MRKELAFIYDSRQKVIGGGFQEARVLKWFAPQHANAKPTAIIAFITDGVYPIGSLLYVSSDDIFVKRGEAI